MNPNIRVILIVICVLAVLAAIGYGLYELFKPKESNKESNNESNNDIIFKLKKIKEENDKNLLNKLNINEIKQEINKETIVQGSNNLSNKLSNEYNEQLKKDLEDIKKYSNIDINALK